jgi:hypothetical protein
LSKQIVASLSPTDYDINIGVLETAHSIFRPWRAQVRSDALFTEINLVFRTFMTPFLQLFRQTASVLLSSDASSSSLASAPQDLVSLAHAQRILVDIYYDFTCQDLPPDLEDTHEEFFAPQTGWFQRFMTFDPESLRVDVSPEAAYNDVYLFFRVSCPAGTNDPVTFIPNQNWYTRDSRGATPCGYLLGNAAPTISLSRFLSSCTQISSRAHHPSKGSCKVFGTRWDPEDWLESPTIRCGRNVISYP